MPNTITATTSTMSGLRAGLPCSRCWTRWAGVCRVGSRSSADAGVSAVCDASLLTMCSSARPLSSAGRAPARLLALGRCLAVDPGQRLRGDELGPRVQVVLPGRERGRLLALADLGDRVDPQLRHLAGVLRGVGGEDALLDV